MMTPGFAVKCSISGIILCLMICLPYFMFSEEVARWSSELLSERSAPIVVASVVVALLILDIALPIPSSLICVAAFALLEGWLAFVTVAAGLTLTYIVGHLLGAVFGKAALNRVFNAGELTTMLRIASTQRYSAIVLSRPLPVLAEATSLYIGSIGTSLLPAAMCALLSSLGLAAMYWWIARTAQSQESLGLALLVSIALPVAFWGASKFFQRKARSLDGNDQ